MHLQSQIAGEEMGSYVCWGTPVDHVHTTVRTCLEWFVLHTFQKKVVASIKYGCENQKFLLVPCIEKGSSGLGLH